MRTVTRENLGNRDYNGGVSLYDFRRFGSSFASLFGRDGFVNSQLK